MGVQPHLLLMLLLLQVLHALLDKLADNVADYVRYQVGVGWGGMGVVLLPSAKQHPAYRSASWTTRWVRGGYA